MKKVSSFRKLFGGLWLSGMVLLGAVSHDALAVDLGAKAQRYFEVLSKRPFSTYLFDRFYNAALDELNLSELQDYLESQIKQTDIPENHLFLAYYFARQGDDQQAMLQYDLALAKNPNQPELLLLKAQTLARVLDFEQALTNLKTALSLEPSAELLQRITKLQGRLLLRTSQQDEARKVWENLLAANPEDADLYQELIELQITEGLYDQAIQTSLQLLEKTTDPYQKVVRQLRLGDIYQRAATRDKALELYSQALEQVGSDTWIEKEICSQIEQVFRHEDDVTGLKDYFKKLQEAQPQRLELRKRHASMLGELGQKDEAIKAFEAILKLTPGDRDNREQYVAMLITADRRKDAITQLQALVKDNPADSTLAFHLAQQLLEDNQADVAKKVFGDYLKLSEQSEYAFMRVIRLFERKKMDADVAGMFEQLLVSQPESLAARESYAAYLFTQKKTDEAVVILSAIAGKSDRTGLLRIARELAQHGQSDKAFELLKAQYETLQTDIVYLSDLCQLAMNLKAYDQAMPWARSQILLASSPTELEAAIKQTVRMAQRGDLILALQKDLENKEQRAVGETCLLAFLYEQAGLIEQSDTLMAQALPDDSLLGRYMQVRFYVMRNDIAAAARVMEKLVLLPQGRKSMYLRQLVELYQRDMNLEKALDVIPRWKELSPGSSLPYSVQAKLLDGQGKSKLAIDVLRGACLKFDHEESLLTQLANTYQSTGQFADAQRVYLNLYESDTSLTGKMRWVRMMGQIANQNRHVDDLIRTFIQRRDHNRQAVEPYLALAELYRISDQYEERRQALLEASRLKGKDVALIMAIAEIEEQEGHWQQALKTLASARDQDQKGMVVRRMATLQFLYGDESEGYRLLYEAAGGNSLDADGVIQLADTMLSRSDWQAAIRFLNEQITKYPQDYRIGYQLLVALVEDMQYPAAINAAMKLLDCDEELPVRANNTFAGNRLSQISKYYGKVMPQASLELLQQIWSSYSVFQYRQQRNMRVASISNQGTATVISLPPDLPALRTYTLAHLQEIAKYLDEEPRKTLEEKMVDHGLADAKLLLALDTQSIVRGGATLVPLLDQFPDNEGLLGLVALMGMQQQVIADDAVYQRIYKQFSENYPILGLAGAVGMLKSGEESAGKIFSQCLDKLQQDSESNFFALQAIAQILRLPLTGLTDEHKAKMTQLLVLWYAQSANNPQMNSSPWMFYMVANALAQEKNLTKVITFFDDEIDRCQNPTHMSGVQQTYASMQNNLPLLVQPVWPPSEIDNFPPHLLQLFSAQRNPYGSVFQLQSLDIEELAKSLDTARSPMLKLLLLHLIGDEKSLAMIDQIIAEKLKKTRPKADDFYLAAIRAIENEKPQQAVELLSQTRYMDQSQQTRQQIDAALVALVVDLPDADEKDKDNARAALLRLRAARLPAQRRGELITAMEKLGMDQQAKALQRQTQPNTNAHVSSGMRYVAQAQVTGVDKLKKDLEQGHRDMVINQAGRQLQSLLTTRQSSTGYFSQKRDLDQLVTFVKSSGIKPQIIEQLSGCKDGAGVRAMTMAGMVCAELDETVEAKRLYNAVIQKNPHEVNVRFELFSLLAKDDPENALVAFESMNERAREQLITNILQQISQNSFQENISQLYAYVDALGALLKQQENINIQMVSQMEYVFSRLNTQIYQQGMSLPLLYEAKDDEAQKVTWRNNQSTRDYDANTLKLIDWRRRGHAALCDVLLKHASTASIAFTHKLAAAMSQGDVDEAAFVQLAQQVILIKPDKRLNPNAGNQMRYRTSQRSQVPMISPMAYMVGTYARKQQLDKISSEFLPKLTDSAQLQTHEELIRTLELYQCDAAEYVAQAQRMLDEVFSRKRMIDDVQPFSLILQVLADRKLNVDVHSLILGPFSPQARYRLLDLYAYQSILRQWMDCVYNSGKSGDYLRALHQLADALLGPEEKRAEWIRRNYDQNMRMGGDNPNERIHLFSEFLNQDIQNDITFLPAYTLGRVVPSNNLPHYTQNCQRTTEAFFKLLGVKDKWPVMIDLLARTPLMADVTMFDTVTLPSSNQICALGMLVEEARKYPEAQRQEFATLLAQKSDNFGTGLLVSLLAKEPQTVYAYLEQQQEQLATIPAQRLTGLGKILDDVAPLSQQEKLTPESRALLQKLLDNDKTQQTDEAQEILNLRFNVNLSRDMWSFAKQLVLAIKPLIYTDRQLALKLVDKGMDIYQQAHRSGQFNVGSTSIEDWYLGRLMDESDGDDDVRLNMLGLIMQYTQEHHLTLSNRHGNSSYYLGRIWDQSFRKHRKDLPKAFAMFYESLKTNFGSINQSPLVRSYLSAIKQLKKPADVQTMTAWIEALPKDQTPDPVAAELAWYFKLQSALLSKEQQQIDSFIEQAMLPRLADQAIPADFRLAHVGRICRDLKPIRSLKLDRAIESLLVEVIDKNGSLDSEDMTFTLRRASNESPREADWNDTVKAMTASVNAFCLRQSRQSTQGSSFNFRSDGMFELMQLNAAIDQQSENNQIARICMDQLQTDVRLWASLLNLNQVDTATAWLVKQWETMRPGRTRGTVRLVLGEDFQKAADALLSSVEAPDLKVLARVFLLIAPSNKERQAAESLQEQPSDTDDADQNKPDEKSDWKAEYITEVLSLSDEVNKTDFRSPGMMDLALEHLIKVPQAAEHLESVLAQRMKSADGLALLTDDTNSGRESSRLQLWITYLKNELTASRFEPLQKCLDQFESFTGDSYRLYRAKHQLVYNWREAVLNHALDQADKDQLKAHLAMLRQLIGKKVQQNYLNYRDDFHAMLIGLDMLANDTPTHDAWLTEYGPSMYKSILSGNPNTQSMTRMIGVLCGNKTLATDSQEKLAFINKLASQHEIGPVKLPALKVSADTIAKWFDVPSDQLVGKVMTQQQLDEIIAALSRNPIPTPPAPANPQPDVQSANPTPQSTPALVPTTQPATP